MAAVRGTFPSIWRLTMGAAVCAGLISYLLLLGALLSDRGKSIESITADDWTRSVLSSIHTDILDQKETLFDLVDDKEWRMIGERQKRSIDQHNRDYDCDEISRMIPSMTFLAAGWTKAVYKADTSDNRTVAIKTVDLTGQDMSRCLEERRRNQRSSDQDHVDLCYRKAAKKLIKEIAVLKLLMDHQNVVKILGYCIPKKIDSHAPKQRVSLVTELGEPVNLIHLLQMNWEDRLRMVLAITRLTDYLSSHPTGSLVMNDMRRQQFVISTNGDLKLVDVDDVGLEEPDCETDADCGRYLKQMLDAGTNASLRCSRKKVCSGANELRNIYNAARHFTTFLLPYGTPYQLQSEVDQIVDAYKHQTLGSHELRERVELLVQQYASGSYLKTDENQTIIQNFVAWPNSDLPGEFDYVCESSLSQVGCSLSVANLREARELCEAQSTCRAFVWMNDKTWTGRTIVHFKNDVRTPTHRSNASLYVKLSI